MLAAVARVMTATLRAEDVLARYGGEEFAVICREIEAEGARALGERLRSAVEQHRFEHAGKVIPVTISVGAAAERKMTDAHALIAVADAAMYEAKRAGRNRVCLHAPRRRGGRVERRPALPVGAHPRLRAGIRSLPARARRQACRRDSRAQASTRGEAQLGAHRARVARGHDDR